MSPLASAGSKVPDPEDRCPVHAVLGQALKGYVRLVQGVRRQGGCDAQPTRQPQQRLAVGPGVARDARQRALLEQLVLVAQRRDVAEVDTGDGKGAAAIEGSQRHRCLLYTSD